MLDNRQTSGNVSFGNPSVLATSPYDHDWIESYTALGDSYAVGLGAGHAVSAATGVSQSLNWILPELISATVGAQQRLLPILVWLP